MENLLTSPISVAKFSRCGGNAVRRQWENFATEVAQFSAGSERTLPLKDECSVVETKIQSKICKCYML